MPADEALEFYRSPGPTSELAGYEQMMGELPDEPQQLASTVRGLLIHNGFVRLKKMEFTAERHADADRLGARSIVEGVLTLDHRPLTMARAEPDRMIGFCYHFALLLCAFMRAKGYAARARCGFASYFRPDAWIDHWVTQYWDGRRWVTIDPDAAKDDVGPSEFVDAGRAWLKVRRGEDVAGRYGNYAVWGWDELRGSLVNDLGALNKVEVGMWAWCEPLRLDHPDEPYQALDATLDPIAEAVATATDLPGLRRIWATNRALQPALSWHYRSRPTP